MATEPPRQRLQFGGVQLTLVGLGCLQLVDLEINSFWLFALGFICILVGAFLTFAGILA